MRSAVRIRLATGLLACVVAWPPLQHVASRTLELDPWSFFGFAMYSVPNFKVTVRAGALPLGGGPPDWNVIPVSSYPLLREYAERRARFGLLLSPDTLARTLLERHTDLQGLVLRIRRWRVSPHDSRLEPIDRDYRYKRTAG